MRLSCYDGGTSLVAVCCPLLLPRRARHAAHAAVCNSVCASCSSCRRRQYAAAAPVPPLTAFASVLCHCHTSARLNSLAPTEVYFKKDDWGDGSRRRRAAAAGATRLLKILSCHHELPNQYSLFSHFARRLPTHMNELGMFSSLARLSSRALKPCLTFEDTIISPWATQSILSV